MTTAKEARHLRARIRDLRLVGATMAEIARTVQVDESQVSRHLDTIRRENVEWFDQHKEPDSRLREFYKDAVDRAERVYRESWSRYAGALNRPDRPPADQAIQGYLNTIMKATVELRTAQQLLRPSMNDLYFELQIKEIKQAMLENRPARNVLEAIPGAEHFENTK